MQKVKSFRNLVAWEKAMALVCQTYRATTQLPEAERFGLAAQMCRSAVSIPSNIAEGQGRSTTTDFLRFLQMARGSAHELSTQAEICIRLGYQGDFVSLVELSEEITRVLNGLIATLRAKRKTDHSSTDR